MNNIITLDAARLAPDTDNLSPLNKRAIVVAPQFDVVLCKDETYGYTLVVPILKEKQK